MKRASTHKLCRIDGDVSDANTKVYGDGSAVFKIFFYLTD